MSTTLQPSRPRPEPPTAFARLIVLDPGLFYDGGHHATLARLLREESARRGVRPVFCGGRRDDRRPDDIPIRPFFRVSAYAPVDPADPAAFLRRCNRETREDLGALGVDDLGSGTLVLVPTVTARCVLALAEWIGSMPESVSCPVAMVLMFPPGRGGGDGLRAAETEIYAEAMARLASLPTERVRLFAEPPALAACFERLGAPRVQTLPWPVADPGPPGERRPGPTRVLYLGGASPARGFDRFTDALPSLLAAHPETEFTVQAHAWDPAETEAAAARLTARAPRVRVLRGVLGPDAYASELRGADIVVLPLDPGVYAGLGSGVFAEAGAHGRALVLPAGTWIAEQADAWRLGHVAFEHADPGALVLAVCRAIDERDDLLARSVAAREAFARDRDPGVFVDRLLATPPASGAVRPPSRIQAQSNPRPDDDFLVDGLWTPQTSMLRSIRDWVLAAPDEPRRALSIDRNPTLCEIFRRRWPGLDVTEACWPESDAQNLHSIPDSSFDLVFSHQVLEHIPKPWLAAAELVRVLRPGGLGVHTTCAANPRHGPPAFNDYYRFLPDGLEQLFDGVETIVKAGWGNRQALLYNHAIDDGHGTLGGRRFARAIGEPNDENFPWATWIIFRKGSACRAATRLSTS